MSEDLRKKVADNLAEADLAEQPSGTERADDSQPFVEDAQTAFLAPEELADILSQADVYAESDADFAAGPGIDRRMGGPTGGDLHGGGGPALGETHDASQIGAQRYGNRTETEAALEAKVATANVEAEKQHPSST